MGIVGAAMGCAGIGARSAVCGIDAAEYARFCKCDCDRVASCAGGGDAPKIFAKRASLYTQMAMFTAVVVMNLTGPGVTVE